MGIELTKGDLLRQEGVDAIVNTVNCVGVMGKGIALQFKKKWPENFRAYELACKRKEIRPGKMFVYDSGGLLKPNFIINFPTKDHWREKSKIEYIRDGLDDLLAQLTRLGIKSVALPPLGCGNGGLDWSDIRPIIEEAFEEKAPLIRAILFEPAGAPDPKQMVTRTNKPAMTPGRAAILKLLDVYKALNYGLSKVEVQKLAYFLEAAGQPLKLDFQKNAYGPYSDRLRHALEAMDGHYIVGLGDGVGDAEIAVAPTALYEAEAFIADNDHDGLGERVSKVAELIDGFQSPYGMELLSTVHWAAEKEGANNPSEALIRIQQWNARKKSLMTADHVNHAWDRLSESGFLKAI
jgi:O-acetyl-ADP-ribose deacetylase (regulator of RNase III)